MMNLYEKISLNKPCVKIGNFTTEIKERLNSRTSKAYSVINSGELVEQGSYFVRQIHSKDMYKYKVIRKYDFAYNPSRINIGSIAMFQHEFGAVSPIYIAFTCDKKFSYYINEFIKTPQFNKEICFSELINIINTNVAVDTNSLNIFSVDGLIKSTLSLSLLSLVFSYSLRYIMIKVFVLLAPFAFISLSLDSTSWFFKSWLKNLFSLLFIQIIVSLVLLILFSLDYSATNLFNKFVYVGGIYALIRANTFVRQFIGGISTNVSQSVKSLTNIKS